jgi:hypothetical protein
MAEQIEKQVTLEFIGKQLEKVLAEMRDMRRDVTNCITLANQNVEFSRRIERRLGELEESTAARIGEAGRHVTQIGLRIGELKDDLEIMFKAGIMGQLNRFETRIEHKIDALVTQ